jgi:hypothetical protein
MLKRLFGLVLIVGVVACDRSVAPGRPLTFVDGGRYGDFILPIRASAVPDTITPDEPVQVYFSVDAGVDPCSYSTAVTVWFARETYVFPWGVRHPGASCRDLVFSVIASGPYVTSDSSRGDTTYYHTIDPVYHRVIVCRPDGSYERRDVVVRVPAPTRKGIGPDYSERVLAKDGAACSDFRRRVLSGG